MLFKDQRADRSKESVESPTLSSAAFVQLKAMPCACQWRTRGRRCVHCSQKEVSRTLMFMMEGVGVS